MMNTLPWATV